MSAPSGRAVGKRATGVRGEDLACQLLERQGYRIVERNWRCRTGEVDVVAQDGATWVFAEVKTRRGRSVENPEEAVSRAKVGRLADLAATWLCEHGLTDADWRIDLVAIELDRAGDVRSAHIARALVAE